MLIRLNLLPPLHPHLRGVVLNNNTQSDNSSTGADDLSRLSCKLINARSIVNKFPELHYMLDNENIDILLVTETWLKPEINNAILTNNLAFSTFRKDRLHSTGGGVCILVNNNSVKAINVPISSSLDLFRHFAI